MSLHRTASKLALPMSFALSWRKQPVWILKPIRLRNYTSLRQFILRLMLQHFAVKIIVSITIVLLIPETSGKVVITNPIAVIISTILIAPIVETLLLQTLPMELSRRFNRPVIFQFCAGMIPFALLHCFAGNCP
jgi:hypothetical protein